MNYTYIFIKATHENYKVPYFLGSQLRGSFGHSLKNITCINPSFSCDGCFASTSCIYHELFEKKNEYHKFRFDFRLAQKELAFSLFLFDDMTLKLPYIIASIDFLLKKQGLSKEKITFKRYEMSINAQNAIINDTIKIPKEIIKSFQVESFSSKVILRLVTPLRIKKNNRFLKDTIELSDITNSIQKRKGAIFHGTFEIKTPVGTITKQNIRFIELTRYSNRQKTAMNLGGLVGEIEIKGLDEATYTLLKIGELIGVGKSSVFGLGKIEVVDL